MNMMHAEKVSLRLHNIRNPYEDSCIIYTRVGITADTNKALVINIGLQLKFIIVYFFEVCNIPYTFAPYATPMVVLYGAKCIFYILHVF